jgi:hypothetical protein
MIRPLLIAMVAGWINRHQPQVITYLKEENQVLKSKLPGGRLRLNDTERRRLASWPDPWAARLSRTPLPLLHPILSYYGTKN